MGDVGVLNTNDRLELVNGEIVEMTPIGSRHAACVKRLNELIGRAAGDSAIIQVQDPVVLGDYSEPQPDLAILRRRSDYYAERHPGPSDIYLIVEVADRSLRYDREIKVRLYAATGVGEVWVVDVAGRGVDVYRSAGPGGYEDSTSLSLGDTVSPTALPHISLRVADMVGDG